jgi:FAD/FMN-containing dehydrogenase
MPMRILIVAVDGSKEEVERNAVMIERIIGENGGFDVSVRKRRTRKTTLGRPSRYLAVLMKYGTLKIQRGCTSCLARKVPELVARIEEIGLESTHHSSRTSAMPRWNIHVNFVGRSRRLPTAVATTRVCACLETFHTLGRASAARSRASHGIGYVKAQYMDYAIDRPTLEIMKGSRKSFDPNGILNPGKMFV